MQHHYEGHWKGWALKIETFLGPEMARAKVVVCKRGGEVSLQLSCVRRYSGGRGWLAGIWDPVPF